jgi:hypothetical protein
LLPCGFAFDCRRRSACRSFAVAFACRASSLPIEPTRRWIVTHEPGRRFPAIVSPVASTRSVSEPHAPSSSYRHWARRLAAGTPTSKLCSPRESVLRRPLRLARLRPPVGALLGFFALQSSLHNGSGFGVSRRRTQGAEAPCYVHLRAPSRRGCIPRPGLRRLGSRTQDPPIRRVDRTPRITVERRSSSPGTSRAPCTPIACPAHALADVISERLARAPSRRHPAPPCPSRPDPSRGRRTLDLEDALASNRLPLPPLARQGGEHIPRGMRSCPPFPGRPRCGLACARPHHPVGPTLAGIEPVVGPPVARGAGSLGFSSLFDPARWCERPAAFGAYAFRTEVLRALHRGRDAPVAGNAWSPFTTAFAVARHGLRRSGRRPSLSRARRAFARQGVRRVASFR